MRHEKTVTIPAKNKIVVYKVTCDLCGSEIKQDTYSAEEVIVSHVIGNRYPEGGSGGETSFDICGKCFDNILIPWLKSQGAEPTIREWDY